MPGDFDSRKDSNFRKLERRPRIFVKLRFRELCGLELSGLHSFDNMAITAILEVIFARTH